MKRAIAVAMMGLALSTAGCKRAATGQVVAVVNGEEITLSDLNAEITASAAAIGGSPETIRAAALQRLIDRKVLVQTAQNRGIDKQPEYLQSRRRAEDDALISLFAQQVTRNIPVPSTAEATAYVAAHPEQFAQRAIYNLDQIQFPTPPDRSRLKQFEGAHDMAAVEAILARMGVKFVRKPAAMDTLSTPPQLMRQVLALPAGEPFVIAGGPVVYVSAVTDKHPAPLSGDEARSVAAEVIRRNAITNAAQSQVKQARAAAKIEYQPGFAPKTEAKK